MQIAYFMRMLQLIFCILFVGKIAIAQQLLWTPLPPQTDASFRGLSVVDDSTAWVSGSKGWVGRSTDGGKSWAFVKVKGYEQCDFRSLYAFDAQTAVIANAGAPAYILYTKDGGAIWKQVYTNTDSAAFFDGLCFSNENEGIIYGDPIKGKLLLLTTRNGGLTWHEVPEASRPVLAGGEASFAASGTTIRCLPNSKIVIATGGKVSRLLTSADKGKSWKATQTPIRQGENTTGIFSVAYRDDKTAIIAGGDYKRDSLCKDHIFYTTDNGKTWKAPQKATRGYRECVEYVNDSTVLATGPSGTDISRDGGIHWQPFSDEKQYHVVRKSRNGSLVIIAGGGGKIAVLR